MQLATCGPSPSQKSEMAAFLWDQSAPVLDTFAESSVVTIRGQTMLRMLLGRTRLLSRGQEYMAPKQMQVNPVTTVHIYKTHMVVFQEAPQHVYHIAFVKTRSYIYIYIHMYADIRIDV